MSKIEWVLQPAAAAETTPEPEVLQQMLERIEANLDPADARGAVEQLTDVLGWHELKRQGYEIRGGFDTGGTLGRGRNREERARCLAGGWFRWQQILLFEGPAIVVVQPHSEWFGSMVQL